MPEYSFQKYGLRDYQQSSCKELAEKFAKGENIPLLLVMPTGTGKTRTAMSLCIELLNTGIIKNIVWVAHRYELLNQAKDALNLCCYLKNGKTGDDYKKDKETNHILRYDERNSFVFSMNGTFRDILGQIDDTTLVVYDEAHHCVSENSTYCLDDVKNKNARILGLTATPFRMNDDIPFVWNFTQKTEEIGYEQAIERAEYSIVEKITISTAILNGYLCRFQIFGIKDLFGDIYREWQDNSGEISWYEYYHGKLVNTIINIIRDENIKDGHPRPEDGKILIFSKNAAKLYRELKESSLLSKDNTGMGLLLSGSYECRLYKNGCEIDYNDNSPDLRSNIINYFSNGKNSDETNISVLINNAILTEGFDEPKVTDIILMYDTNSSIRMTQIIGRGLRPYGDEERGCYVYNLASADIVEKIYNGKQKLSGFEKIEEFLGEQVGVTDEGKVVAHKMGDLGKNKSKVRNAFPRSEIYEQIKSASLYKEFEIAGVLIADDLIQCIVSTQEIEYICKGEFPRRMSSIFRDMLHHMYVKWQKIDNPTIFNTFIEYLRSCGKYKPLDDPEKQDIGLISSDIMNRMHRICNVLNSSNSIRSAVESELEKEGMEYTALDLSFYCGEVLKTILKV